VKTYMDDFLGALAGAVKNGTKIIGVGPSNWKGEQSENIPKPSLRHVF
jgi:hypothetical protein